MMSGIIVVAAILGAWPGPSDAPPADARDALQVFDRVTERVKELGDWSTQHVLINAAMRKVWERNGWNDEADQFALKLMEDVNQVPPWEFPRRISTFSGKLAERYQLSDAQTSRMETLFYQESLGFVIKHARVVIDQTRGMLDTRVRATPFTPEQIAGWARESEPLLADGKKRMLRIADQLAEDMTAEQREILRRDLSSGERRFQYMEHMRQEWAAGRWRPEDWGLDDDPIQSGAGEEAADAAGPDGAAVRDKTGLARFSPGSSDRGQRLLPYDETTWGVYERRLIAECDFDAGQRAAADSILNELVERAGQYRRDHLSEIADVPPTARIHDPALAPIRQLFEELKTRLNALPSGGQRARRLP